jgi:hypothetical protein
MCTLQKGEHKRRREAAGQPHIRRSAATTTTTTHLLDRCAMTLGYHTPPPLLASPMLSSLHGQTKASEKKRVGVREATPTRAVSVGVRMQHATHLGAIRLPSNCDTSLRMHADRAVARRPLWPAADSNKGQQDCIRSSWSAAKSRARPHAPPGPSSYRAFSATYTQLIDV